MENIQNEKNPANGEKTFTQEEVNRIISERLGRERDKKASDLEEREKAVLARELAVLAAEKLAEAGLPKELSAVLKYDDESSLASAIQTLSKLRGFDTGKKEENEYKVIPNPLRKGIDYNYHDPDAKIHDAFKPPKD